MIVDDHPIVRQGLAKLLSDEQDLVLCGEAQDAREAQKRMEAVLTKEQQEKLRTFWRKGLTPNK